MTKERLRHYSSVVMEKKQLLEQLEELIERDHEIWSILTSVTAQPSNGMPRGGGGVIPDNKMVEYLARRQEISKECRELLLLYHQKVNELHAEQLEIERAIDTLDIDERRIMRCKYIEGRTWEEACVECNYSWTQIHRIHRSALEKLKRI